MATLILALAVTGLSVAGLAAGLLLGRAAPRGSCGGAGCDACSTCPNRDGGQ